MSQLESKRKAKEAANHLEKKIQASIYLQSQTHSSCLFCYLGDVSNSNKVANDAETQCNDSFVSTEARFPIRHHCRTGLDAHKLQA